MADNKTQWSVRVFVAGLLLWFLRMVLPGMIFIYLPFFVVLSIFFLIKYFKVYKKPNFTTEFIKSFTPVFLLLLFYLVGISFSSKIFTKSISDLFEFTCMLLFLFYFFILLYTSQNDNTLKSVFKLLISGIGISSVIIAILGLIKYYLQLNQFIFPFETPIGTSINTDQNFYALFSFLGIISFIPIFFNELSLIKRFFWVLIVLVLSVNILFSFSFRSLILLTLGVIGIFIMEIYGMTCQKFSMWNNFAKNTRYLFLIIVLFLFPILVFMVLKPESSLLKPINTLLHTYNEDLFHKGFRFEKWKFAFEYFSKQEITNKIFGSGFNYLSEFGQHFYNDPLRLDYPHNPIISALLYSGLLGAIFAILFLTISVYYSIIYFRQYPHFSFMLWVSLLFVFFSGNSLFSVPVFLFLFSLSFLIRHQEISDLHIDYNLDLPGSKLLKEFIDYVAASISIIIISPLLLLLSVFLFFFNGWPIFYSQTRVGQNGKTFRLHKFRTMKKRNIISSVAAVEFNQISALGNFLRKTKLDELPELWNIIRGDMSFVGPRPDVPGYADVLIGEDRIILKLKPGLTGPASLKYINEDDQLIKNSNPQKYNDTVIFPDKVRINRAYMKHWSFWLDFKIIIFTALRKKLKEEYFQ